METLKASVEKDQLGDDRLEMIQQALDLGGFSHLKQKWLNMTVNEAYSQAVAWLHSECLLDPPGKGCNMPLPTALCWQLAAIRLAKLAATFTGSTDSMAIWLHAEHAYTYLVRNNMLPQVKVIAKFSDDYRRWNYEGHGRSLGSSTNWIMFQDAELMQLAHTECGVRDGKLVSLLICIPWGEAKRSNPKLVRKRIREEQRVNSQHESEYPYKDF